MVDVNGAAPDASLQRIIESAERLVGVHIDEEAALQWLTAMATQQAGSDVVVDTESGVYGHRVTMLDFSPQQLVRFRELGRLVEFEDIPGKVETALALSGSAAQSKIQTYPGDADFFERVNVIADTQEEACQILGQIMREKALKTLRGDTYQLIEVKLGSYPEDMMRNGRMARAGSPIGWTAAEVEAGQLTGTRLDGTQAIVTWEDAAREPGWCKLDWVVADPAHGTLGNASNMLDATWGGTGRHSRASGWISGPLLPRKSIWRRSRCPSSQAGEARFLRRPCRLRGSAGARGGEASDERPHQLREGGQAALQHLPSDGGL